MLSDHGLYAGAIRQVETKLGCGSRHHLRPHHLVRAPIAFADVVIEPHQEQQVRPGHGGARFRTARGGKDGVVVHGVSVRALARQQPPDVLPLWDEPLPQSVSVHLLDEARSVERRGQQAEEGIRRGGGPAFGQFRQLAQLLPDVGGHCSARARRSGGHAQEQPRLVEIGGASEADLAPDINHPDIEGLTCAVVAAPGHHAPRRCQCPLHGLVHRCGGSHDGRRQVIAVGKTQLVSYLLSEFGIEDVAVSAGGDVEERADVEKQGLLFLERWGVGEVAQGEGPQELDVAQAAPPILDIRVGHRGQGPGPAPAGDC